MARRRPRVRPRIDITHGRGAENRFLITVDFFLAHGQRLSLQRADLEFPRQHPQLEQEDDLAPRLEIGRQRAAVHPTDYLGEHIGAFGWEDNWRTLDDARPGPVPVDRVEIGGALAQQLQVHVEWRGRGPHADVCYPGTEGSVSVSS